MEISVQEAVDVLLKWQHERRLIQAGVFYSTDTNSSTVGRVEQVSPQSVRI